MHGDMSPLLCIPTWCRTELRRKTPLKNAVGAGELISRGTVTPFCDPDCGPAGTVTFEVLLDCLWSSANRHIAPPCLVNRNSLLYSIVELHSPAAGYPDRQLSGTAWPFV
jgi:hypothetical protein